MATTAGIFNTSEHRTLDKSRAKDCFLQVGEAEIERENGWRGQLRTENTNQKQEDGELRAL